MQICIQSLSTILTQLYCFWDTSIPEKHHSVMHRDVGLLRELSTQTWILAHRTEWIHGYMSLISTLSKPNLLLKKKNNKKTCGHDDLANFHPSMTIIKIA